MAYHVFMDERCDNWFSEPRSPFVTHFLMMSLKSWGLQQFLRKRLPDTTLIGFQLVFGLGILGHYFESGLSMLAYTQYKDHCGLCGGNDCSCKDCNNVTNGPAKWVFVWHFMKNAFFLLKNKHFLSPPPPPPRQSHTHSFTHSNDTCLSLSLSLPPFLPPSLSLSFSSKYSALSKAEEKYLYSSPKLCDKLNLIIRSSVCIQASKSFDTTHTHTHVLLFNAQAGSVWNLQREQRLFWLLRPTLRLSSVWRVQHLRRQQQPYRGNWSQWLILLDNSDENGSIRQYNVA